MSESTISDCLRRSSPHASLAVLGLKLQQLDLFAPIRQHVHIGQKTICYSPTDKLYDGFVALLAGAAGLVEINSCLRSDPALQAAFGRRACAEQSVVQDTLDACTEENVSQLQQALDCIYRRHSAAYRHDYTRQLQVIDIDFSGAPCGPKAAFATPGYFARVRKRVGRQVGRVVASHYNEIVCERLYAGNVQLVSALLDLLAAAQTTLQLDEACRGRTVIRVDAGGGSVSNVNAVLAGGYHYHGKDYSGRRAPELARSVREWVVDPHIAGRQAGWVDEGCCEYGAPIRRIAVRCRKKNGQWGLGILLSSLEPEEVLALTGQTPEKVFDAQAVLLAYVYFYDDRGGGAETTFKEDKQGLGRRTRNKKRFAAQAMVNLLGVLAHNVLVWARSWLAPAAPRIANFGLKRLVRDVWRINGLIEQAADGSIWRIVLNQANRLAHHLITALALLVQQEHVVLVLGET